jgi:hypothetical protein
MIYNIKNFCLLSLALFSAVSNAATLPTRFNNQVIMSDNLTLTHLAAGACYLDAGHSAATVSTIGATELGYLAGLTGNVQTQINAATTSLALPAASVFVGSASNVAVAKPVSGAITIASTGVTTLGTSVVSDTNVAPGASVGYTKLNLTGKITAADIQVSAGIPYNKLSLLGSITNSDLAGSINDSKLLSSYVKADGTRTLSADWNIGSHKLTSLSDPTSAQDAATKSYVDTAAANEGVAKKECQYATAAALPTYVYANGSSGVGATLTGFAFGAITVDGSSPSVGDRILVKNETAGNAPYNGIYTVTTVGSGAAFFVLTRATDFNQASEMLPGSFTYIVGGSTLAGTTFSFTTSAAITVGTTSLAFAQTAGPGSVTGGTGITVTGSSVALTTPVAAANGGTGLSSVTSHGVVLGNGASALNVLPAASTGTLLTGQGASADPAFGYNPVLGVAGATQGSLSLAGSTSGQVKLQANPSSSTFTFQLPNNMGTVDYVLRTDGFGATTWVPQSGGGGGGTWTYASSVLTTRDTSDPTVNFHYRTLIKGSGTLNTSDTDGSAQVSSTNGLQLFVFNGTGAGTSGQPNQWLFKLPAGKAYVWEFYQTTGRAGSIYVDYQNDGASDEYGAFYGCDAQGLCFMSIPLVTSANAGRGFFKPGTTSSGGASNAQQNVYFDVKYQ